MTYCTNVPLSVRVFYINGLHLLTIILAAISIAVINPVEWVENKDLPPKEPAGIGPDGVLVPNVYYMFPRYQSCKLNGNTTIMTEKGTCNKFKASSYKYFNNDKVYVLSFPKEDIDGYNSYKEVETTLNISMAILVINIIMFIVSVCYHEQCKEEKANQCRKNMLTIRPLFSIINIGLFVGLVAQLYGVEDINADYNVKYNVYFEQFNLVTIAITGLVIHVLDIVGANLVVYKLYTSDKCFQ